jgi:uncharacterized protein YndB with AHSA1/START domain
MFSDTQTLTFTQSIKASPLQVFYAFTHASAFNEWLCDFSTVIPNPGGRIYLWWNMGYFTSGEFTVVEKDKKLSFTWHGRQDPSDSNVTVTLVDEDGSTLVTLEHTGLGTDGSWTKIIQECKDGWEAGLENLASVLETGKDLRYIRRPMLGIIVDEFNADIAKQLGVPVDQGMRIDDPVAGMGAEAAGLQSDDVIVSLARQDTTDFPSLTNVLQSYQAGDKVEVAFYRGDEKKSVMMELSSRAFPDIPEKTTDFSKAVETGYAEQYEELAKFLDGVTEEEASFKPSEDEWSIKETIAHLVQGERGWNIWISGVIGGYQPHYDDFGGNLPVVNQATLAAFPTLPELLEEIKRLNKETVALVKGLPDDLPIYKNIYWRLGINLLESPYHFEAHLDQMEAALEASRM